MFDWNDLRYFLAVARSGSTIAAAKILGVNQSTVQRRLAVLEGHFGRPLVERHPTGYELSEFGKEMLSCAEGVEQAVRTLERRLVSRNDAVADTVRVTCPGALLHTVMTPLVQAFHARYPGLKVDLVVSERNLDLSKGEADVAIRAGEPRDEGLICRKLAEGTWAIYASHSYIERSGRPDRSEDLDGHAIIAFGGTLENAYFSKWLRKTAPSARVAARSETVIGALIAVKAGEGLGILPVQLGDTEQDLVRVIGPICELRAQFNLLVHPDLRDVPRVRAFIEFIVVEIAAYQPLLLGQTR